MRLVAWVVIEMEPTDPTCTAAVVGGGVLIGAPIIVRAADDSSGRTAEILVSVRDERIVAEAVTVRCAGGLNSETLRDIPLRRLTRAVVADHHDLAAAQRRSTGNETTTLVVAEWQRRRADPETRNRATIATAERLYLSRKYVSKILTRARREGRL